MVRITLFDEPRMTNEIILIHKRAIESKFLLGYDSISFRFRVLYMCVHLYDIH